MDVIDLRHFSISTKPVGVPRTVRKTSVKSTLPNLGNLTDVADFVLNGNDYDSASEIDEEEKVEIKVPQMKHESSGTQQRAIRLTEIGPRLRLELVKIEEGMCDGKVLYHRYVHKSKVRLSFVLLRLFGMGADGSARRRHWRRNIESGKRRGLDDGRSRRRMLPGGRRRRRRRVRSLREGCRRRRKKWILMRKRRRRRRVMWIRRR